eukprot:scaffold39418_cov50-Phaeocystis_antarctica.AAC.2
MADLLLGGEDDGGGHVLRDVTDAARVRHHALHLVRVRVRVRVRIRRSPPEGDCKGLRASRSCKGSKGAVVQGAVVQGAARLEVMQGLYGAARRLRGDRAVRGCSVRGCAPRGRARRATARRPRPRPGKGRGTGEGEGEGQDKGWDQGEG